MSLALAQVQLTPPAPVQATGRVYHGRRRRETCEVWVEDEDFSGQRLLFAGRPGRPLWGTSGPATFALTWALIRDASGDRRLADDWSWSFAEGIVKAFPLDGFVLRAADIVDWLEK